MMPREPLRPRPGYEALRSYAPGVDEGCAVDLSDNTNQWGVSPAAASALASQATDLTRYPTRYGDSLKQVIARRYDVPPEMVITGAGSDGVLEPAIRAFGVPGDRLALPDPTFVMAASFGVMNGLVPVSVPLRADYDVDVDGMLAAEARITYLCSPNNPTGTALSAAAIARIAEAAAGLVIIDEAYAEFAGRDALDLVRGNDRLLITRTFSKAYGLAGLRVGYGIAAPAVVAAVEKARGPYTIGAPAELAASAAMRDGHEWMQARARDAVAERERLRVALHELGLQPAPSDGNFLFLPIAGARRVAAALARRGIAVRAFTGLRAVSPALEASGGEALRITVAPWEVLAPVVEAIGATLAEEARR